MPTTHLRARFCCCLGILTTSLIAWTQDEPAPTPSPQVKALEVEAATSKLVKIIDARVLIDQEATDWQANRQMLEDLIKIREREAVQMDVVIDQAKERVADVETKSNALAKEEQDRKAWRLKFERRITSLEDHLIEQLAYLPPPVTDQVFEAIEQLKNRDDEAELQARFRDVSLILNKINEFNTDFHIIPEIRTIQDAKREVEVLYLGMSQAWFVDRTNKIGGIGTPSPSGWQWREIPGIAAAVRKAIDVQQKKIAPDFVTLPLVGTASEQ